VRALLSVAGIALGVALGFGVHLMNRAAVEELATAVRALSGDADLEVRGGRSGFDETLYQKLARLPGVAVASPGLELQAAIAGGSGPTQESASRALPSSIRVIGIDSLRSAQLQPALFASDPALRTALLEPDAVLLSAGAARMLGLGKGDDLVLVVGLTRVHLRIAGILAASALRGAAALTDIATAQWRLDRLGTLNRIDLRLAPGAHRDAVQARIAALLPSGVRVQAVVQELQGERIDIIPWSHDIATFVVNALAPAEVAKVVLDEDKERIEVVVPDQQLSLAIGRRGQNVRLASQLTGWDIDILTEQEESERRQAEFENRTKIFVEALNLDEVVGQLLASEGFGSIEELALVDEKEIAGIEGFDADTARELQERAKEYLAQQEAELDDKRKALGVEDALKDVPGVTNKILVALGENGVKTVEDLAGCATDDLTGWTERKDGETKHEPGFLNGLGISREDADAMIMQARLKAGWVTEAELAPPPAEESAEESAQPQA